MSVTLHFGEPKIGTIVYRHCTPVQVGIILEAFNLGPRYSGGPYAFSVQVHWFKKGKLADKTLEDTWSLADYTALTESHERKAKKFRATIDTIREQATLAAIKENA